MTAYSKCIQTTHTLVFLVHEWTRLPDNFQRVQYPFRSENRENAILYDLEESLVTEFLCTYYYWQGRPASCGTFENISM